MHRAPTLPFPDQVEDRFVYFLGYNHSAKIVLSAVNKLIVKALTSFKKSKNYQKRISRANTPIFLLKNLRKNKYFYY